MNYIQFSFPASGTHITARIATKILNLSYKFNPDTFMNDIINSFKVNLNLQLDFESVLVGAPALGNDGKFYSTFVFYDNEGNIVKDFNVCIDNYMNSILNTEYENTFYIITHTYPNVFFNSKYSKSNCKKIYVVRDFRNLYHSFLSTEMKRKFKNKGNFLENLNIKIGYYKYDLFFKTIREWKNHVIAFLERKSEFLLVKYEDLINAPHNFILNFAEKLNKKINKLEVQKIADELMYKNVFISSNVGKWFKHFSPRKKIGLWKQNFSSGMIEDIKNEIGDILIELGYEKDFYWDIEETDDNKILSHRENIEHARKQFLLELKATKNFLREIEETIKNKKVVIYGTGDYSEFILKKIKFNKENLLFFVDDDETKKGKKFFEKKIKNFEEMLLEFRKIDYVLIAVNQKFFKNIFIKVNYFFNSKKIINLFNNEIEKELLKERIL